MVEVACVSCGTRNLQKGAVRFRCPKCGKVEIWRCEECRNQSRAYTCRECGFVGP
ncbi:MAG: zinc finger domain-containing protein [Thermoplasmata archaeon]